MCRIDFLIKLWYQFCPEYFYRNNKLPAWLSSSGLQAQTCRCSLTQHRTTDQSDWSQSSTGPYWPKTWVSFLKITARCVVVVFRKCWKRQYDIWLAHTFIRFMILSLVSMVMVLKLSQDTKGTCQSRSTEGNSFLCSFNNKILAGLAANTQNTVVQENCYKNNHNKKRNSFWFSQEKKCSGCISDVAEAQIKHSQHSQKGAFLSFFSGSITGFVCRRKKADQTWNPSTPSPPWGATARLSRKTCA